MPRTALTLLLVALGTLPVALVAGVPTPLPAAREETPAPAAAHPPKVVPAGARGPMPVTMVAPATSQAADLLEECTIAVLSGQFTGDGRPILWKNRDSGYVNNEVAYFTDGIYPYVTVINAGEVENAWVGVNEAGFAVLNALSYNLPDSVSGGITNGWLMKLALRTCATVDDFEKLLGETASPGRENPANLGVIDARGGAAIFEVGSRHHHRFDASGSDGNGAGFLVRANFSLSADTVGLDTWRFRRATALLEQTVRGRVRRADLFGISRDLGAESCDPYPLPFDGAPPGYPKARGYVDTRETIQRVSTVTSGLIEGVRRGEDPRLSTFFVALGQPAVTPFVPVWVAGGSTPPELDGPGTSPLCDLAIERAQDCHDYPYVPRLINTFKLAALTAPYRPHLVLLRDIELWAHARVDSLLEDWRPGRGFPADVREQQKLLSASIFARYQDWAPPSTGAGSPAIVWRVAPQPMRHRVGIVPIPAEPLMAAPERIEVHDVLGRRVAELTGGTMDGFAWDGRDESGRSVPAGLYFGRVPGVSSTARILVVR